MPQPINLPPETGRKCGAGGIIHVGEWVMNWKGSRECAAPSVALWDGSGVGWKHRSIALRSSLVLERQVSTSDCVVGSVHWSVHHHQTVPRQCQGVKEPEQWFLVFKNKTDFFFPLIVLIYYSKSSSYHSLCSLRLSCLHMHHQTTVRD